MGSSGNLSLDWIRNLLETTPTGPLQPWAPRKPNANGNAGCEPGQGGAGEESWESSSLSDALDDQEARLRSDPPSQIPDPSLSCPGASHELLPGPEWGDAAFFAQAPPAGSNPTSWDCIGNGSGAVDALPRAGLELAQTWVGPGENHRGPAGDAPCPPAPVLPQSTSASGVVCTSTPMDDALRSFVSACFTSGQGAAPHVQLTGLRSGLKASCAAGAAGEPGEPLTPCFPQTGEGLQGLTQGPRSPEGLCPEDMPTELLRRATSAGNPTLEGSSAVGGLKVPLARPPATASTGSGPFPSPRLAASQRPAHGAPLERAGTSDLSAVLHNAVFRATSGSKRPGPFACHPSALKAGGGQDSSPSPAFKGLAMVRSASAAKAMPSSGTSDVEDYAEDAATPTAAEETRSPPTGAEADDGEEGENLPESFGLSKRKRILRERQRRTNIRHQVKRLRSLLPRSGTEGIPEDTASIIAAAADYIRQLQSQK